MADTIWGQSPLSAALGGMQDVQSLQQQDTRAQQEQLNLNIQKEDFQTRLATRAALSKAQKSMAGQDMSSIQSNIKMLDSAISQTNDPEVKQSLFSKKTSLLSDAAALTIKQGQAREDERAQTLETASQALTMGNADGAAQLLQMGTDQKNPLLQVAGLQMQGKAPIAMFNGAMYADLSPEQKTVWELSVKRALEPKAGESTIRNAYLEMEAQKKLDEKTQSDKEANAARQTNAAANRNRAKTGADRGANSIPITEARIDAQAANDINKLRSQQQSLLVKAGMPVGGKDSKGWFAKHTDLPPEVKNAYDAYDIAIKARQDALAASKAVLHGAIVKPKAKGTAEDPIKLD